MRRRSRTEKPYAHLVAMQNGTLEFISSYDSLLIADFKAAIPWRERKWHKDDKVWRVAPKYGQTVADLVKKHLGLTIEVPTVKVSPVIKVIRLMYLGTAKERANGEITAYGWVDDAWSVVFPLQALRQWFEADEGAPLDPSAALTLYSILGVRRDVEQDVLRSAYRRAARAWHPDVNGGPDATAQFQRIQAAYATLKDPAKRARYDAGLRLEATLPPEMRKEQEPVVMYRPPVRCGYVLVEGWPGLSVLTVNRIRGWEDIITGGRTLVTYWPPGADEFVERWMT